MLVNAHELSGENMMMSYESFRLFALVSKESLISWVCLFMKMKKSNLHSGAYDRDEVKLSDTRRLRTGS